MKEFIKEYWLMILVVIAYALVILTLIAAVIGFYGYLLYLLGKIVDWIITK